MIRYFAQRVDGSDLGLPEVSAGDPQIGAIMAIIFGVAAALAALTIVIAAFNFATAGGDTDKITRSKDAIVYALVGLVISLTAEAIVLTLAGKL